jgi:hypothetical protein
MRIIRMVLLSVLSALLVACSSAPSDGDVQDAAKQSMVQADAALKSLGIQFSEVFDINVKVLNKADKGNKQWLIDAEISTIAKKALSEFPRDQQMAMGMAFGQFEKGKVLSTARDSFTMTKGEKGWILSK